ncbi:F-box domain-containing protein [Heracleum sosnowskyi]|uniref:F-box domain-containing protein n=1 Tax=Heracleum sosnowskyi TaxID=360622 RepID=A0AAD8GWJ1_9APIA|nr:F-box domain-containing protein [Heracleum sosnowskyi]
MENLPLELNTNILTRLPIKTLGQLKCVSKPFKTLITSHHLTKTHLNLISQLEHQLLVSTSTLHTLNIFHNNHRSPLHVLPLKIPINLADNRRGEVIELVGSCNGLVCLFYPPNTYSLLNPTTREYRVLPDPGRFPGDARIRLSGFGYVEVCDDYMVVSIGTDNTGVGDQVIRAYSAKTDSWKTVLARVPFRVLPWVKPVCVNGVVHWLGFGGKFPPVNQIIGFDFAKEEFRILPLMGNMNERGIKALGVMGGCFCVLSTERDRDSFLEMWIMMEYGVKESWIRTLSFGGAFNTGGMMFLFPVDLMWLCTRRVLFHLMDTFVRGM